MLFFNRPTFLARFCSRTIDYCLFFGLGLLVSLAVPFDATAMFYLVAALATPIVFIPFEALLLRVWGKTPGKALFGFKLGSKLSFGEAFRRALLFGKRPGFFTQKPPHALRIVFGYALTLALLGFSVFSKNITEYTIGCEKQQKISGWVHYCAKDAGFHVNFPSDPQVEAKEVTLPRSSGSVNVNEYTSQKGSNVTYSVSYMDLPKKWAFVSSKRILRGVFDVIMKLESATQLNSKEFATHNDNTAMNFSYKKGDEEVVGRLIRVGQRLFKLTISYPSSLSERPISHEFLDSFHLESPQQQQVAVDSATEIKEQK